MPNRVGWSLLRGRFRSVELLILEDLEGLEHFPLAREELVHTLTALESTSAAVAFSARNAPATWLPSTWPRRLTTRLMGGLAVSVALPGLASRRRYILQHGTQHGITFQAEAVEALAQAADGYRTLEGWLSRLAFETRLTGHDENNSPPGHVQHSGHQPPAHRQALPTVLDLFTVTKLLSDEACLTASLMTIDTIARDVARRFRIRLHVIRGPSRQPSTVQARHVAMYLARTCTGSSFASIGRYFGGRDPATVRHACKMVIHYLATDAILTSFIDSFITRSSNA